jgi:micrococcal nuclease
MYEYRAKVIRIVDGDTVDAAIDVGFKITINHRLRIAGIDTPEVYRPCCEAELQHGRAATERAKELLLDKDVLIRTGKELGIYGRYIAEKIILNDARNFVEVMKEEGFEKKTKEQYLQEGA